ncbi:magnesium-translocating P-type ATPase [Candidatus Woesebacteria bacterium RIFCSPLOWO2_01_FULL_39_23]|uniref:Magnesium-transporting ATPase, P-type 1 n=1 Tax=Candidatus Woesebacteria bacterium RIFCSPHIGHO2_01_FULL_40_22 TaxID=1802499 RepID=A0A1F7YJB1_9BACT|nr:MAG: magnesium-translocating P-type ATPase [Candidatus Woesebacteria bacterium RBG_16_40_11]OGM27434.1 MAG: magnesium-translocating P-type ATPase [Candidatus Woesebacteria bacterium RIFCSPHIGHO2_01_FULL_40_22]OGM36455.1 MAG: magnesium-translocating P-type ATPase [Candidatus Woesebacteria bacterium RIFCSPHIGHO2_12_FULL_38_9]OGM62606.1 MAG: magnesium-translocating P-type ATPase [Candidatus Woesebacteria bacterium RIFCSPLOWO2_01_FULL_39_23]
MEKLWNLNGDRVLELLQTSDDGLSTEEAIKRFEKYGDNIIGEKKPPSAIKIFFNQFKSWLILILLSASILSFYLGEHIDALVIIFLVLLSVTFGFLQEYKANKTIFDLKKFITNKCRVLRDHRWVLIDSRTVVPGDIVEVRIGDKIPADIRILSADSLLIDESILTGESLPVNKTDSTLTEVSENPSKLKNIVFMGSTVSSGKATGVVIATGNKTFFGKTAQILEKSEPETDFQQQIKAFSAFLFKVIIIMTVFIFISNSLLKKEILESFLFALALAVGITPEMLPAIITVTLSQGAIKMAKRKVIVKRLISVEDFGNIDTLCMDKTGTLTEGKFSLDNYQDLEGKKSEEIILFGLLCTRGLGERLQGVISDPIDRAIWQSVQSHRLKAKLATYKFIDGNEFDYERRRMSVLVKSGAESSLISKGAPESILSISTHANINGKNVRLTPEINKRIEQDLNKMEKDGFRVIAISKKDLASRTSSKNDEKDMVFMGYLLFSDPVKISVKEAIERFTNLGVSLKVLSGDSLIITKNIAFEAGLNFKNNEMISGDELEGMSQEKFSETVRRVKIFARVTPEHKYKIIKSLNYEGHIVGFLGDGVNDAPALREADVGISVDSGVDIAKDASDIILLKKDLKVLSEGIEAGRKTFGNIMKYILNTISANYGNMFTVALSSLFLKFIPLLPSQILLNNFISDVPLFAVATDNVDPDFVKKPKRWNISFIKNFMVSYGFVSSAFDLVLILPMIFFFNVSVDVFRTAWFVESSLSEMLVTFTIRTKLPFYKSRPSKWLIGLSMGSAAIVLALSFLEVNIFKFVRLPMYVWGLIIVDLVSYFIVTEIFKKKFFTKLEEK